MLMLVSIAHARRVPMAVAQRKGNRHVLTSDRVVYNTHPTILSNQARRSCADVPIDEAMRVGNIINSLDPLLLLPLWRMRLGVSGPYLTLRSPLVPVDDSVL